MIFDLIITLLRGIVEVLLLPLTALNFSIDLVSSIPVVGGFIKVIAYLFPWSQITPLITIVVAIFAFRAIVSLIKTIWEMLPIL